MDKIKNAFNFLAWGTIICLIIWCLSSCRTKYVAVPEIHKEYVSKTDSFLMHDSIYMHDSVLVQLRGDSVFTDRWHTKYVDRLKYINKTDTICKTDSIAVPYEVVKYKTSLAGWGVSVFLLLLLLGAVYLWARKMTR